MGTTRVLAVDDDPVNLALLVRVLAKVGIETLTAPDGVAALQLLKANPKAFDAVLLDLAMPRMGGLQLLKRLKGSSRLRPIPVILQTAANAPEEIQRGLAAGAHYYLTKPLNHRLVQTVVRTAAEVCARHRALSLEAEVPGAPLSLLLSGEFAFRTLPECHQLANLLAKLCPEPARTITGLSELLLNALEHGNLGITYQEKSRLLDNHHWKAEVQRRQLLPENREKRVLVRMQRLPELIRFEVEDEGPGFDWREYVVPSPARVFDNHGRGILMARIDSFDRVEYQGSGNRVVAEVYLTGS